MNQPLDVGKRDMTKEELEILMSKLGLTNEEMLDRYRSFLSELTDRSGSPRKELSASDFSIRT